MRMTASPIRRTSAEDGWRKSSRRGVLAGGGRWRRVLETEIAAACSPEVRADVEAVEADGGRHSG